MNLVANIDFIIFYDVVIQITPTLIMYKYANNVTIVQICWTYTEHDHQIFNKPLNELQNETIRES